MAVSDGPRPSLTVLLDDGTGTYPYDVTGYVNLRAGVTISRGRPDENADIEASTLRLQLDNRDGRFTQGLSPYGVYTDQPIRVVAQKGSKISVRFTGFVQSWPTQWETVTGSYAVAQIAAVDRFPRLARHTLQTVLVEEILLDKPTAFYPLTEPAESTSAGDVSGNRQDTLTAVGDDFARVLVTPDDPQTNRDEREVEKVDLSVQFGTEIKRARHLGTGAWIIWKGDAIRDPSRLTGGDELRDITSQVLTGKIRPALTTDGATVELFVKTKSTDAVIFDADWLRLYVSERGYLRAECAGVDDAISDQRINDNDPHHVAVKVEADTTRTRRVSLIVDGNAGTPGTGRVRATDTPERSRNIQLGGRGFTGTVSHLAIWNRALPGPVIRRHGAVGLEGIAGDPPEARLARLAAYSGVPQTTTTPATIPLTIPFTIGGGDTGLALEAGVTRRLATQETAGVSMLDAARAVERAEDGVLFINGSGQLVLHNRRHRIIRASSPPTLAVPAERLIGGELTFTVDPQFLVNQATGAAYKGGVQRVDDRASIARHEVYAADLGELLILSDREVLDRLSDMVAAYAEPRPRASAVPVDLLTSDLTTQQSALSVEIGDRLQVTDLPTQAPAAATDLIVEGWTEVVTDAAWSMTFNTSPADAWKSWVLGVTPWTELRFRGY